jgi:hypothetical protein
MGLWIKLDPVRIVVIRHNGLFYSSSSLSPLFIRLAHSKKDRYGNFRTIMREGERLQMWDRKTIGADAGHPGSGSNQRRGMLSL